MQEGFFFKLTSKLAQEEVSQSLIWNITTSTTQCVNERRLVTVSWVVGVWVIANTKIINQYEMKPSESSWLEGGGGGGRGGEGRNL